MTYGGESLPVNRWRRAGGLPAALLVVAALLAGCGGSGASGASGTDTPVVTDSTASGDPGTAGGEATGAGSALSSLSTEELVVASLKDIEGYWEKAYPGVFPGQTYTPVSGGFRRYTATEYEGLDACGTYTENADNAFYCPSADLIAWDETEGAIIPKDRAQFGDFTVAVIMAHEVGHALQSRAASGNTRTVTSEQQADCFAGAWAASVVNGESPTFNADLAELDNATAGLLDLADPVGTDAAASDAHGSAFDRISAFQDGLENGPAPCAAYTDASVAAAIVQVPFTDAVDKANNGNQPFDEAVKGSYVDLEDFWQGAFTQNGETWTPLTDLTVDPALLQKAYTGVGDFAVATLIGHEYARKVQAVLGTSGTEMTQSLQADCLTGVWSSSVFLQDRPSSTYALSPGDLDEAVTALLLLGDPASVVQSGTSKVGSKFLRVEAFRTGFLKGFDGCQTYTDDTSPGAESPAASG